MGNTVPVAQLGPYKWGDDIKTSLFGRRSGLDFNEFYVGGMGGRDPIELWTSGSTGAGAASTAILAGGGISVLQAATASTFQLPAPAEQYGGAGKTIQFATTGSTSQTMEIDLVSGNFQTSLSSTYSKLTYTLTSTGPQVVLNGALFLQCVPNNAVPPVWYWALNGSTGAAGGGSTHIAFS